MKSKVPVILMSLLFLFSVPKFGAIPTHEREALIAYYYATNGDNWTNKSGWKDEPLEPDGFGPIGSEGDWDGVLVVNDHVVGFHKSGAGGNLPPEIGNLSQLEFLWLENSQLSGTIPPELGNLNNLHSLDLSYNQLTGSIPPELGNMTNLSRLELSYNNLSGSLPSQLGNLSNLDDLVLNDNQLTGPIPSQLGNISTLQWVYLNNNQLTGNIPPELGNLDYLFYLNLNNNQLSGNIPPELGNIIHLECICLGNNQLSGSIPPELGNITKLFYLDLSKNQLSGCIPQEFGNFDDNMDYLDLSSNQLTGSIPVALGNIPGLVLLDLSENRLTGTIPKELENIGAIHELNLSSNQLSGNIPPELGNITGMEKFNLSGNQLRGEIPPELGNFSNLDVLDLSSNQLTGTIPPELGNFTYLDTLDLSNNMLTGSIPAELGNHAWIDKFDLSSNKLSGEIPGELRYIPRWADSNLGYNALYATDGTLRSHLNQMDPDWENTQTIAPEGLTTTVLSSSSVRVSWIPIIYTQDTGGYQVYYRQKSSSSWIYAGITSTKLQSSYEVTGLKPGTTYFFKVKTRTDPHSNNQNTIISDWSETTLAVTNSAPSTYKLTVQSSPDTGVSITVTPNDIGGNGNGTTNFTRTYYKDAEVTLTAPDRFGASYFSKWTVDGIDCINPSVQITINHNYKATVHYVASKVLEIQLNRTWLNFGYELGDEATPMQEFAIYCNGGIFSWTATADVSWLNIIPTSGTGSTLAAVYINPAGLSPGTHTGNIAIAAPGVSNSPQTIEVTLTVYSSEGTSEPFGEFSTPIDGSSVRSSIAVTGWALDDIKLESVTIYRGNTDSLIYIGDAVFVEGARPDVEQAYPDYPMNYKAGWGYMMLTNFLPNGGNGTFKIHAIATDVEGHQVTLGTKTIIVDNANAVKPFGAIDTPTQGGIAAGSSFINWGWVLTPLPNRIPTDGSSIKVWVDGINIGQPTYNVYRADISALFPGYANSDGAAGYFYIDTTAYENGVHTIQWTAKDNAGNTDGIGSRYFTIHNPGNNSRTTSKTNQMNTTGKSIEEKIPLDLSSPVKISTGYRKEIEPRTVTADKDGMIHISIPQDERIVLDLSQSQAQSYTGHLEVNNQLRPLPPGSSLDSSGTFYWQPGPASLGKYHLVFLTKNKTGTASNKHVIIEIIPKFTRMGRDF